VVHSRTMRAFGIAVATLTFTLLTLAAQGPPSDVTSFQIIVMSSADEAEQARRDVNGGADFTALAREKSIDPTARDGGHLVTTQHRRAPARASGRRAGIESRRGDICRTDSDRFAILRIVPEAETKAVDNDPARTLAALASGATRDAIPVSGLSEADSVFQSAARGEGWNEDLRQMCQIRTDSTMGVLDRLETMLGPGGIASDTARATPSEVFEARYALAQLHAYSGNLDKAVSWWRQAEKTVAEFAGARPMMNETLGVALLHKSEMDNGIYREAGDMCLFPPRAPKAFANSKDSEQALRVT